VKKISIIPFKNHFYSFVQNSGQQDSIMRKLRTTELERMSIEAFKVVPKDSVVVVLDNIRSGLNVGSVFRTCDAFAISHLYLCGITANPPHREILKSAIGATESVSWSSDQSVLSCILKLKEEGYKVWAVEQTSESIRLDDFTLNEKEKIALVFGNEVEGVSDELLPLLDGAIEIPQWGTKHSLNISVCAGIVLWHLVDKKRD